MMAHGRAPRRGGPGWPGSSRQLSTLPIPDVAAASPLTRSARPNARRNPRPVPTIGAPYRPTIVASRAPGKLCPVSVLVFFVLVSLENDNGHTYGAPPWNRVGKQ
eukprot:387008-Pyramimonas_sp.AAC.1